VRERGEYDEKWGRRRRRQGEERRGEERREGKGRVIGKGLDGSTEERLGETNLNIIYKMKTPIREGKIKNYVRRRILLLLDISPMTRWYISGVLPYTPESA